MTPQEAIDIVNDVTWFDNGRHYGKIKPARDLAVSALEKQIPKKPKRRKDTTYNFCPCCDSGNLQNDYCTDCGQKIDWSDTE